MPADSKTLTGSYTIPDALKKRLEEEIETDAATAKVNSQTELNARRFQNDYNKQKYHRDIDLNFDSSKPYKEVLKERQIEKGEHEVVATINDLKPREQRKRVGLHLEDVPTQPLLKKQQSLVTDTSIESAELSLVKKLKENNVPVINGIPLTDEILTMVLPEGYVKTTPPLEYQGLVSRPQLNFNQLTGPQYYEPPSNEDVPLSTLDTVAVFPGLRGLEYFKEEDKKYFGELLQKRPEELSAEEQKEVQSMKLVLKAKNGTRIVRKRAMRSLTENAVKFGPKTLLSQILPVLLEPSLDEQERHLLIKMMSRIMLRLNESIRPYTLKVIHVLSPFLIDESITMRTESREIISNLTKAVGFANMVSTLRPDLDHVDEYVRNVASRVLAIVASTIGLQQFLPFLKAVVRSKQAWTARHTGIKIVQQLCISLGKGNGSTILPFLLQIVEILTPAINDELQQVRAITALTLAQLAESVEPYGIDSFERTLDPLWYETKRQRGRVLAAYLRCIGSLIPLMVFDPRYEEYTNYYVKEVMYLISKQYGSPDEDMRKTVLKVLLKLPLSKQIVPEYQQRVFIPFFRAFWNRRTALESSQVLKLVIAATQHLASRFNTMLVLRNIIHFTKDDNEQLRRLAVEAVNVLISANPDALVEMNSDDVRITVDGVLFAFQEQSIEGGNNSSGNSGAIYLHAFNSLAKALSSRLKPYLGSIISSLLYRMKNKSPEIRQQSCDLVTIIAPVIGSSGRDEDNGVEADNILSKLILILYESLGEVYPDVLGSIINALHACVNSINKDTLLSMSNPSINQILPTLTPILKNRHEKVQESSIKLIGLIATRNAETINAKEWMRICFDLLEMLKSSKKRIRIAANATFGHIANTIGPQDVIVMLLNNLKVQERQLRVCTAVAMGIVAEKCQPFTVLPAIMNEYRTPEKNVQNGILKALSFLFEYLDGKTSRDYLFAITPLLEDALIDRDLVHRQTAATVVSHVALNVYGLTDGENIEVFVHFLNLVLPNIFETSPHVISRILESLDSLRVTVGNGVFMNYVWAALFHPARKVREPFWKLFNSAYVQCADSLVPSYPRIDCFANTVTDRDSHNGYDDDHSNERFSLQELDLCL
ncbi:hypothetical protein LELG_04570 [Lodderomyces elongisporus NRRL YB-4239]|uniref:Phosphatase PP2A regulatory subunit A/Splicing factor 3B subunit 1-like HEAT repeat domain-containing protein n=1 Tax=Lodderomyces elongisporus (strain ATCC 11503 / CBS 2605 / JCM 1781 / NBRC 1676 / NRRL YB-4239) TaxID=379508 RepID=A5E4N1_LODEL|nr:hypothetical protein LELG_04570 [Lodderomyces elongisporus NRRL YB-4239]